MEREIADEIQDAVDFAEASADEDVGDLMKFVYSPSSTVVGRPSMTHHQLPRGGA